ncbi:hypothetical protein Mmc1_2516 [Magnetococcus marinus MC-1]|uniref:DUF1653 domain-containing protein n=1 Tax=Magnetococcus marinus (strain ATCC BAA-1437 / JCM 17883 / MC-1) TaxID=156889 RepID=A0LAM3_MAGMM|nr:DUF1653 domain-containing protein [Magnetococcus marinus]ABK45016.1 hypothetical protein Mmc1_2516 [Magnetococcus marinus MC-1]
MPPTTVKTGRYRHYKGGTYRVLGMVRHSEDERWMVHYLCEYDNNSAWVRPLHNWLSEPAPGILRFAPLDETMEN